ncbi:hypothetical protein KCU90_g9, partial [Aureobasidium melanogenum]
MSDAGKGNGFMECRTQAGVPEKWAIYLPSIKVKHSTLASPMEAEPVNNLRDSSQIGIARHECIRLTKYGYLCSPEPRSAKCLLGSIQEKA